MNERRSGVLGSIKAKRLSIGQEQAALLATMPIKGWLSEWNVILRREPKLKESYVTLGHVTAVFVKGKEPGAAAVARFNWLHRRQEQLLNMETKVVMSGCESMPGRTTGNWRVVERAMMAERRGWLRPDEIEAVNALISFYAAHPEAKDGRKFYGVWSKDGHRVNLCKSSVA